MNKKLITAAVAAGLALPMVSAHAVDVADKKLEVYGKLHVNLGKYDELKSSNDNWRLDSNASRLGFKGQQKLTEGLTGTYKFEFDVAIVGKGTAEGSTTTAVTDSTGAEDSFKGTTSVANESGLKRRNMYVGLKGGFGEVRIGRHDSPLKMAQGKFDQFGDTQGDLKNAGDQDGENRHDNSITYLAKFGDFGFNAQIIPGEGDGKTKTLGGTGKGNGLTNATSIAVSYKTGPVYLAVAQDSYDNTNKADEASLTRAVLTYKLSGMQLGAFYQTGVEKAQAKKDKENWLGLSANFKIGQNNKLKAQYITVKDSADAALESKQVSVGIDHKLGKKGTLYLMHNTLEEKNKLVTKDNSSVSVGYILKF